MTERREREIDVTEHPEVPWLSVVLGYGPMLAIAASAAVAWPASGFVRREAILLTTLYAA